MAKEIHFSLSAILRTRGKEEEEENWFHGICSLVRMKLERELYAGGRESLRYVRQNLSQ